MAIELADGDGKAVGPRGLPPRDRAIGRWWGSGRRARLADVVGPIPPSTALAGRGAGGGGRLRAALERRLPDDVVVLHDRAVPGRSAKADHIAVSSTGVWVIDTVIDRGRVERRALGSWRAADDRLYVDGRDRTELVAAMSHRVDDLRAAIESTDVGADVRPVLCFTDSEWSLLAKPFVVAGVVVTYPSALVAAVSAGGLLLTADVRAIAAELDRRLPPA